MEPRIARLLADAALAPSLTTIDTISLPSLAPRRPLPVEPSPVGDDRSSNSTTRRNEYEYLVGDHNNSDQWSGPLPPSNRGKSGVPIAEVLNNEKPRADQATALAARFSGRLSDILLDPSRQDYSKQRSNKRRKVDEHTARLDLVDDENNPLKLPKLPQLPKKTARRPRIPPLLQGLHQPPPLPPEGRLFPPITGEAGGFRRNIGERAGLRTPPEEKNRKNREKETRAGAEAGEESSNAVPSNGPLAENEQESNKKPVLVSTNDKEERGQGCEDRITEKTITKTKKNKKRNKWSEQETKDLLYGVSKFGIGNWKKILECEDFHFDQRTAVDLKDRFRTCCPGQGLKLRKPKSNAAVDVEDLASATEKNKEKEIDATGYQKPDSGEGFSNARTSTAITTSKEKKQRKPRADTHKKGPTELAEMGIQGPFKLSTRRERREFTEEDDRNLLEGYERYKVTWHAIRDDKGLGFHSRQPTDLRDRFRIRYPELYQKAGFKLKPKEELLFPKDRVETNGQETAGSANASEKLDEPNDDQNPPGSNAPTTIPSAPSNSNLRAHALRQPLLNSFPSPFEDFAEIVSEDDDRAGSYSPITLNRNIFNWADAHPSQSNPTAGPSYLTTGDAGFNLFAGMDGYHINPLATLTLPSATISNSVLGATLSYPPSSHPLSLSFPSNPVGHTNTGIGMNMNNLNMGTTTTPTAPPQSTTSSASTTTKQSMSSLLRTPNLPTIVYPHVPAASARNTMHNLPPPADLLSSLDPDVRMEQQGQHSRYYLDDGMSSTLAPLMGQTSDRILMSEIPSMKEHESRAQGENGRQIW